MPTAPPLKENQTSLQGSESFHSEAKSGSSADQADQSIKPASVGKAELIDIPILTQWSLDPLPLQGITSRQSLTISKTSSAVLSEKSRSRLTIVFGGCLISANNQSGATGMELRSPSILY